jgi:hypothetical protein
MIIDQCITSAKTRIIVVRIVAVLVLICTVSAENTAQPISVTIECPEEVSALDFASIIITVENTSKSVLYFYGDFDEINIEFSRRNGRTIRTDYELKTDTSFARVKVILPGERHSFGVCTEAAGTMAIGGYENAPPPDTISAVLHLDYFANERWVSVHVPFSFRIRPATQKEYDYCKESHAIFRKYKRSPREFVEALEVLHKETDVRMDRMAVAYRVVWVDNARFMTSDERKWFEKSWMKWIRTYCSKAMFLKTKESLGYSHGHYRDANKDFKFGGE